jgi:leucyl/phenylalanyl-tRNA--protein transferase
MIHFLDRDSDFPDARLTDDHGMLAVGGDLSTDRLLNAYRSGIFPWYNDGEPICWWSPDPRMVFDLRSDTPMRLSKSLKQSRRNRGYEIRKNTCFETVMTHCAHAVRNGEIGTWINEELILAFTKLHHLGHAQSIEVFKNDELIGGLYGIDLPEIGIFCGESMFAKATDASKIALWHLVEELQSKNYKLIDAQVYNEHLASLGAVEMDREVFLSYLNK